jgi:hypothetical protein
MKFWPVGTIFVSVVDPGVGTPRKASVALTTDGYYVVTPDNGSLTHLNKWVGITEIREIDESVNRLKGKGTEEVSIFHGRDLFSYCAARLASGIISFEGVGPDYPLSEIIEYPILEPKLEEARVSGIFEINDPNFGNLWTNIPLSMFKTAGFEFGDYLKIKVFHDDIEVFSEEILFHKSFGFAKKGDPMIYNNELMKISLSVSQGSFSGKYNIGYGSNWMVEFSKSY